MFADGGYAGPKLRDALVPLRRWTPQTVKRSDTAKGSEVLPRGWVVVLAFAWLGLCRSLAKDRQEAIQSSGAWLLIAHVGRITRFITGE